MGVFDVVENTPSYCVDIRIVTKCDGRGSVTRETIHTREEVLDISHSISGTGVADGGIGLDVGDTIKINSAITSCKFLHEYCVCEKCDDYPLTHNEFPTTN